LGLWNDEVRNRIKLAEGSIADITEIPEDIRARFRTVWEIPMRGVIDMAADRGAYLDQSQSLNLFIESPSIGKLSSMYMYAWKKGLKTTYYLRSRPATRIAKATVATKAEPLPETPTPTTPVTAVDSSPVAPAMADAASAVACSLENPENCEACQ